MNKLLCIVGPTATGKTKTAIEESHRTESILVSADSRQVYRGMDIVTGKDHPADLTIYGIDIVDPDQDCSVSVWYDAVIPHIKRAWGEGKQVIVVGGTGLYVKALTHHIETIHVPINQVLRDTLSPLSITKLQEELTRLDAHKFATMNHSDSLNPRRLIRAIEITNYLNKVPNLAKDSTKLLQPQATIVGLKYFDNSNYRSKVHKRVLERLGKGAIEETKLLLTKYGNNLQSISAIGYQSIIAYLNNELSYDQMIDSWVSDELAYAKRQLTWFRKQPVIWYDVDKQ